MTSPSNKKKQVQAHHDHFFAIKKNEAIEDAERKRKVKLEEARLAKLAYERAENSKKERCIDPHQRIARNWLELPVNRLREEKQRS